MSFSIRSNSTKRHQLNSKEKKYVSNVEKALSQYESVSEWADYISYLSKLQKALQYNPEPTVNHWIPNDFAIAKTLGQCTSSNLPSGVHRKAIEVYDAIFTILGSKHLSNSIQNWLPGLLPLMSYASISVKPELIALFNNHVLKIDPLVLRVVFKAILLSLLPALDDTTSESFNAVLDLISGFKIALNNDAHFWQCLFLCIITSPDKRSGALEWCNKKLPDFSVELKSEDEDETGSEKERAKKLLSDEALSCVTPEPGLLIRAFCEGLKDENVLVQRGFFDLLVSRLEISSVVIQVLAVYEDRKALLIAAAGTVLRKDMSLNRRLWNWMLGPEIHSTDVNQPSTVSKSDSLLEKDNAASRLEYFEKYGAQTFVDALYSLTLGTATSNPVHIQKIHASKIAIAIMDKWEIGQLIVPKVLPYIINSTREATIGSTQEQFDEVLKNANAFFDGVESIIIWAEILRLIETDKIETLDFILNNFHIEDEDMVVTHIPLVLLSVLLLKLDGDNTSDSDSWLSIAKHLLNLIPQRAFLPIEHADKEFTSVNEITANYDDFKKNTIGKIHDFYFSQSSDESPKPFSTPNLTAILLSVITKITCSKLTEKHYSFYSYCERLNDLLEKIPTGDTNWRDETLIDTINSLSFTSDNSVVNIPVAFGLSSLFHALAKSLSKFELLILLKVIITQLWACIAHPTDRYQVEAVKQIWNLEINCESMYIEASLASLFLNSDGPTRVRAFNALWAHSTSVNVSDTILTRPLLLILDGLSSDNETDATIVSKMVKTFLESGSMNRVFKICFNALLQNCTILDNVKFDSSGRDDFSLFAYHLKVILSLLKVESKEMASLFSSEMCVMDNDAHIAIVNKHNWNIATYKTLLINIILRYLSIEAPISLPDNENIIKQYSSCTKVALTLLEVLVDGTESDFPQIPAIIGNLCIITKSNPNTSFLSYYYLSSLSRFMKISSDKALDIDLFASPTDGSSASNFVGFFEAGIENCSESVVIGAWMKLLLDLATYYPELTFKSLYAITSCVCLKAETLFNYNKRSASVVEKEITQETVYDVDESIIELISGLKDFVSITYQYYKFHSTNNKNSGSTSGSKLIGDKGNEAGFFGTVMQGVFQVETYSQRNEEISRRNVVLVSLKQVFETSLGIWLWADENSKLVKKASSATSDDVRERRSISTSFRLQQQLLEKKNGKIVSFNSSVKDDSDDTLHFSKSLKHNAEKLRFRAKKLLECIYSLERMESLETLIACRVQQRRDAVDHNKDISSSFKIIHVLDGSKSQVTLPLIINSLICRVSLNSLPTQDRSSMITELSENDISSFLVEYAKSLTNDVVEDVWPQVSSFIKEALSNPSIYKYLFPDILKFTTIICTKLSQSSFGEQKKARRDFTDAFVKVLNATTSAKYSDESSMASLLNPMNILPTELTSSADHISSNTTTLPSKKEAQSIASLKHERSSVFERSGSPTSVFSNSGANTGGSGETSKQSIAKEELCSALIFVAPMISNILQDNDKTITCLSVCINSTLIPLLRSQPLNALPPYVRSLFITLSEIPTVLNLKIWKTFCSDLLYDTKFFSLPVEDIEPFNQVLQSSITEDKEKMSDLIAKILPYSSGSALFSWNDSEGSNRILHIKRVIYLLMICPVDHFLLDLNNIQARISDILNSFNSVITPHVLLLVRAIILKFSEPHLSSFWPMIYNQLRVVFQDLLEKIYNFTESIPVSNSKVTNSEDIPQLDKVEFDCQLLLSASKLLDVALLLKKEEFQLVEWLFVSETSDAIYPDKNIPVLALIDQLSNLKEMRVYSDTSYISSRVTAAVNSDRRYPLLRDVTKCNGITDLKSFFDHLSIYNYESDYKFKSIDLESAEQDIFSDLFTGSQR